jgi:polyhydroxyalkanoate synthesis regulator phasin
MGRWQPSKAKRSIYYTCVGGEADALEEEMIRRRHKREAGGELDSKQRQVVDGEISQRRDRLKRAIATAAQLPTGQLLSESTYERIEMALDQLAVSNKPASDVSEQVLDLRAIAKGSMHFDDADRPVRDLVERARRHDPHMNARAAAHAAALHLEQIFSKTQIKNQALKSTRGRVQADHLRRLIVNVSESLFLSGIEPRAYHSGRVGAYKGTLVQVLSVLHSAYPQTLGVYDLKSLFECAKQFMDERRKQS